MSAMKGDGGGDGGGVGVGVVRCGFLKKLKTSRKKWFVLRDETPDSSARLEYYDTERKYQIGLDPKKSIPLKNCFNINRRFDTKHKHVIALHTKDDSFCMVLDNEEDTDSWLKALLKLQHGEEVVDGEAPKPTFEHVWQVTVLNRGLGNAGLVGNYRLCLTDKTLSLIKRDCQVPQIELNLSNIRSCGNLRDFFFLEIGRSSSLGAGELWMQTEDSNIAENVHSTVFHAMSTNCHKDELGPKTRNRSSSANEASKPNSMTSLAKKIQGSINPKSNILTQGMSGGRDRCDSMPSRAPTTSESSNHTVWNQPRVHVNPYRPASLYGRGGDVSHSPPTGSPVSPPSVGGCSTDSAGSSYSLADETDACAEKDPTLGRYGHSLTPDEAIAEEECPDSPPGTNNYVSMGLHSSDDGYVDMSPRGRHHNNSPTASMSSVTSGTPSTDMRFAEYPLEKVTSYLTTAEDAEARPIRAYSVGSKPEGYKKYTDMLGQTTANLRDRAFSLGAKAKKVPGRVLPPHGCYAHPGTKSSSAPLLSNSRGQGSHNSIGPMDDLMEMDFSRSGSINNSGYMDMRPSPKNHGYVEMKPINSRHTKPQDTSPYVDMSQGSSPTKPSYISPQADNMSDMSASNDYMDMDPRKNNNNNNNNTDYLTMSFNKRPPSNYQLSPARASPLSGSYQDCHFGSPKTEPVTPDGYVEMSLGRGHQRQSSLDSSSIVNEDYANMSMGKKRDRDKKKKDKTRSQPIAIQNPNCQKTGASFSPRYAPLGRKYSTGTPPMHLPLTEATPYSSLPRQHRRRDSNNSSSSSVTTPSSSSTIFPFSLNSPSSPPTAHQKKADVSDYTPMDFENKSDYVNYNPRTPVSDDYAVMKPGVGVAGPAPSLHIRVSDSSTFRPISETDAAEDTRPYEVLRAPAESARTRPNSASSELCSSGSTVVGSRPESVNSDRVRPASVSSADVQLHYASLDLEEGNRSPRTVKEAAGGAPAAATATAEVTLTYAAIDFVKSEGLKHNSISSKVKH